MQKLTYIEIAMFFSASSISKNSTLVTSVRKNIVENILVAKNNRDYCSPLYFEETMENWNVAFFYKDFFANATNVHLYYDCYNEQREIRFDARREIS